LFFLLTDGAIAMKPLSNTGHQAVNDIAQRHGFSPEAATSMAQFNHPLKGCVNSLCSELSQRVLNQPDLLVTGSFQSRHQGSQQQSSHAGNPFSSTLPPASESLFSPLFAAAIFRRLRHFSSQRGCPSSPSTACCRTPSRFTPRRYRVGRN